MEYNADRIFRNVREGAGRASQAFPQRRKILVERAHALIRGMFQDLALPLTGSVLICFFLQAMAAFSVLRIHSEIFMSLALASAVMRWTSSGLNRTGTIRPLASPLGSFGRPIFLGLVGFDTVPELLNDCRLYGGLSRHHGRNVKYCDVALRVRWIVHHGRAPLANPNAKPHDGVAMNARQALD